jgi:hypothetical protein
LNPKKIEEEEEKKRKNGGLVLSYKWISENLCL